MSCRNCSCCNSAGYKAVADRLRELAAYASLVGNGTLATNDTTNIDTMIGSNIIAGPTTVNSSASQYLTDGSEAGTVSAILGTGSITYTNASACVRLPCGTITPLKVTGSTYTVTGSDQASAYCTLALQLEEAAVNFDLAC